MVTIDTQPLLSPEAAVLDGDVGATERYAFSLTRLGVSLLDHSPRELIFLSAQGVLIERVVSDALLNLECSFASLQVDNMLDATQQPVMLRANPQAHAISPCAFHASALKLRRYTSLHYFRHISFFLQELDVALDWQVTGRHRHHHHHLLHHRHPHLTTVRLPPLQLFIAVGQLVIRLLRPLDGRGLSSRSNSYAALPPPPPPPDAAAAAEPAAADAAEHAPASAAPAASSSLPPVPARRPRRRRRRRRRWRDAYPRSATSKS